MAQTNIYDKMEITAAEAKRLKLPTTRRQQFWDILKNQLGNLTKLNILSMLLALPFLALVFVFIPVIKQGVGMSFDFTGNLGIGYPGSVSDMVAAEVAVLQSTVPLLLLLIPCITLLAIPFAGLTYTIRNMVWGESVSVRVDYWKGIKTGWKQFLLTFFVLSILVTSFVYAFMLFNIQVAMNMADAFGYIALIIAILGILIVAGVFVFMLPAMTMYNLRWHKHIKNGSLLFVATFPQTMGILLLTVAPFVLGMLLGSIFEMLIYMLVILLGASVIVLLWTVYAQYVLDKSVNKRSKNTAYQRGIYVAKKTEEEGEDSQDKPKTSTPKRYVNPKKKKKATPTFEPLRENYSREDIMRMQEEKEKFLSEIDEEDKDEDDK